ncbi:MAG: radical SAM protein [Deltaproteobacteria bacterium]|nr:radical SAM protein [Deltaproteobacteria bacterium]
MDCPSNRSIFLRANGSLICWCDYGNKKILKEYDEQTDYGEYICSGEAYATIREQLSENRMPFPEYCQHCIFLQSETPFDSSFRDNKTITHLQVEPSYRCQLECVSCIGLKERKKLIHPPYDLEPGILKKVLQDLSSKNIKIEKISFEGHGEPILNKGVWEMARIAKSLYPDTHLCMTTNANLDFDSAHIKAGFDEIIFAIDGVDQVSYEKYRVRGNFEKAFSYMKNFAIAASENKIEVSTLWKYVLFGHNDSKAQLSDAQKLAKEAGVSAIIFVATHMGPMSTQIRDFSQIPLVNNGVLVQFCQFISFDDDDIYKSFYKIVSACHNNNQKAAMETLTATFGRIQRLVGEQIKINNVSEDYSLMISILRIVLKLYTKKYGANDVPSMDNTIFDYRSKNAIRVYEKYLEILYKKQLSNIKTQLLKLTAVPRKVGNCLPVRTK